MASAFPTFGFAYLCFAFAALHFSTFLLDPQCAAGTGTAASAEAPLVLLDSAAAAEVLPLFAAAAVLYVAVALIYHHLSRGHLAAAAAPVPGAAGNGRRAISGLLMFLLCVSMGTLELIVFGRGQAAAAAGGGGGAGHGAQARALGLAALRALPAAATGTFFCGIMVMVAGVAHVRAGGEHGAAGAVAGDGAIQVLLRVLPKVAAGMAAALVGLMVMAFASCGAKF